MVGGLLVWRMVLQGRPPVTNLYSSAIFIGFGAAVLGLLLEAFWRNSIGVAVSAIMGFITLIIAHHLSLSGDTMEMMRAVLDTNFWLATHVVVVTLGYASTFVAGLLAIIYIIKGVFTRSLTPEMSKSIVRMIYGIICFTLRRWLQFCRCTVLGGIWADQSWGRFWGWDPKENGAVNNRAVERADPARALGRPGAGTRFGEPGDSREYRDELVMVRGEHAGHRVAFVRVHERGVYLAGGVRGQSGCTHHLWV